MVSTRALTTAGAVAFAAMAIVMMRKKQIKKNQPYPMYRTPLQRLPLSEMPRLKNDLLLRALRGEKTERVPVWCMRQAGRHLPEFRALRDAGYNFFTMCEVPELAVEVSLQPFRRYHTDAVIIFSDILIVLQAMGMEVKMVSGVGPVLPFPVRDPADMASLNLNPDIEQSLGYVLDALNLARQQLRGAVPVIGFCGGPLTLLCYMIEGGGSRTKAKLKTFLYNYPEAAHQLLDAVATTCANLLIAQQQAGAQALQVFETVAAEAVTREHFNTFVFPYLKLIAAKVKKACPTTPIICFSKGTSYAYSKLAQQTEYDCLGLDWQSDPAEVREQVGDKVSLQGNMDSSAIYASPDTIRTEVKKMLRAFGTQKYVANLGHGCFPDMDPAHVNAFIKAVQEVSLEMNAY